VLSSAPAASPTAPKPASAEESTVVLSAPVAQEAPPAAPPKGDVDFEL
jgi:hypothetical protein